MTPQTRGTRGRRGARKRTPTIPLPPFLVNPINAQPSLIEVPFNEPSSLPAVSPSTLPSSPPMAPKTMLAQRRWSTRIQIEEPMPSPSSPLPSPQPVASPNSLAIVLYKASEKPPMSAPEAQPPPPDLSKSVETATTSPGKVKPPNKKKPISKGKAKPLSTASPSKGRKSGAWHKTAEPKRRLRSDSSKGPTSSATPSSPEGSSPPSKRQKASSSPKQVSIPKPLLDNMLELVRVPNIVQERSFCVNELGGLFRQVVVRQGWEEMLARLASARLNLTLVREFYACLAAAVGPSSKAESLESSQIAIRGKQILLNPSSIRYALSLPAAAKKDKERMDSEIKLMTKEHVVKCCYMHPPSTIPFELICGQLHASHRALGHLVRAVLYPTTQTSQLPLAEGKLLCYLATVDNKLPVEFYLYESMKKTAISIARGKVGPKTSLFHPAVITVLCHQQGIDVLEGDEFSDPVKLSMSSVVRGNAQCVNPGLTLDVETILNVVKKNAADFETKMDRRLTAIEGAVSGVQTMVRDLHDALVAAKVIPAGASTEDPPCQS